MTEFIFYVRCHTDAQLKLNVEELGRTEWIALAMASKMPEKAPGATIGVETISDLIRSLCRGSVGFFEREVVLLFFPVASVMLSPDAHLRKEDLVLTHEHNGEVTDIPESP